jgi:transposase
MALENKHSHPGKVSIMSLLEMFCDVDDFCQQFLHSQQGRLLGHGENKPGPQRRLSLSEVMTILILFHQSDYRTFKHFYIEHVRQNMHSEFPHLVSYNRFVEAKATALLPLCAYLLSRRGATTGISFIDATALAVCHNRRIARHRVFAGLAARSKTSMGWFYGFKLHLIVNERGELLRFYLTPGNVDDRQPVPHLARDLWGKLFGDKGYISQALFEQLFAAEVQLITPLRKNMKNRLMPLEDKLLVRKRSIIETINDQLKNISQIEHTRHRSVTNALVNLIAGLLAYTWQPKKPSLNLSNSERKLLPALF